jgi:hypothetical protein
LPLFCPPDNTEKLYNFCITFGHFRKPLRWIAFLISGFLLYGSGMITKSETRSTFDSTLITSPFTGEKAVNYSRSEAVNHSRQDVVIPLRAGAKYCSNTAYKIKKR